MSPTSKVARRNVGIKPTTAVKQIQRSWPAKVPTQLPQLVFSGHVHDYQRFTRSDLAQPIPYVVIGNSGYHNLHRLAPGSNPGEQIVPGVTFEYGDDAEYGFLKLTIGAGRIHGEYVGVTPGITSNAPPQIKLQRDTFNV